MFRKERIGEQLQSFLGGQIASLADPRVELVTITEVRVSNDYRVAKVFWTVPARLRGDSSEKKSFAPSSEIKPVQEGLESAKKLLRRRIAEELTLRYVPDLTFLYDKSAETGSRIDELLNQIGVSPETPSTESE